MPKRVSLLAPLLLAAASLPGCLYAKIRVPLDEDVDKTEIGTKEGRATTKTCLWLFSWGDGGTITAAKNGQMTTINHLDEEVFILLFGLYGERTTVAYGD